MNDARPTFVPVILLGRFALLAGLLLLSWRFLGPIYQATTLPLINGLLRWENLPFALQLQGGQLLAIYGQPQGSLHSFLLAGQELASLGTLTALALFAATPGCDLRWKARWLGITLPLFWTSDAISLGIGVHLAILDYLGKPAPTIFLNHLVGLWTSWGKPLLLLILWFAAVRPYLGRQKV